MTIGLFTPLNGDLTTVYNILSSISKVRLLSVGSLLGPTDIIVYPDNVGIIPDLPGLRLKDRAFVPSKPINPHYLQFVADNPIETMIEDRGFKVIGIGDAAAMLYSEIGGKLMLDDLGNARLFNHTEESLGLKPIEGLQVLGATDDLFIDGFICGDIAGVNNYTDLKKAIYHMRQKVKEQDSEDYNNTLQAFSGGPVRPPLTVADYNNNDND